ncbi:hypothetical protein VTK73DRAFT_3409 [Phialemonium thermophilum]|uniref:Uncharacterized protein n=1 Tax=Phialemonium thermophilum TaxID=223376 RepID=A0ABR3X096_9PEZI
MTPWDMESQPDRDRLSNLTISERSHSTHKRVLHDCTRQSPRKNWVITDSMLQAYTAMRGRGIDMDDPFMDYLHETDRQKKETDSASTCITENILNGLRKTSVGEDASNQEQVFRVPRPAGVWHMSPQEDYDLTSVSDHNAVRDYGWLEANYGCADGDEDGIIFDMAHARSLAESGEASYISDEEGYPARSRISPCTFRLWASGTRRWDDGHEKPDISMSAKRLRPSTPDCQSRKQRNRRVSKGPQQFCHDSNVPLSPTYSISTNPSIVFTPPGVSPEQPPPGLAHHLFDRMNPLAARELRELRYGKLDVPETQPTEDDERYTMEEVIGALVCSSDKAPEHPSRTFTMSSTPSNSPGFRLRNKDGYTQSEITDVPLYGGVTSSILPDALRADWATIADIDRLITQAERQAIALRKRAASLSRTRADVSARLPTLRAAAERRARIREHAAAELREVRIKAQERWDVLVEAVEEVQKLRDVVAGLEDEIEEMCREVGMSSPQELLRGSE